MKKIREKENFEFYEFYGLKRLNIPIDGIDDKKKNDISTFDITENSVYLNQISKTGRSFDSGLLIKKDKLTNEGTHDLVLTQESINKILNSKKRDKYFEDSFKAKTFLESLYKGLKIDKIYFIFIVPDKYNNCDSIINQLKSLQIYYIFFDYSKNIFLDCNKVNIISDLRIKEASIAYPSENFRFMKTLTDIHLCRDIFNLSKKKYLQKKKNKKFIDIYEKLSKQYFHDCIKFFIPFDLKKKIVNIFYSENLIEKNTHINFIPSANFIGLEIEEFFKENKNMIIFSPNDNIYLYYYNYFQISDNFNLKKIENLKISKLGEISIPNNNLDSLNQLKKYPLYPFCYYIVENYSIYST